DLSDGPHLPGQVGRHHVDVVGQVLPGARHAADDGLAAELALGAHFAGHPGHLAAKPGHLSTHRVMVSFSSRISPRASTRIFWLRSPLATAVVTSAMDRTWPVRLFAIELTLSVRSFQVPDTPLTSAWPPSSPSVPTSRATRVTSSAKEDSWSTIVFRVDFSSRISPRASTPIFWLRSPLATAVATWAMLRTCPVRLPAIAFTDSVRSFQVPDTPGTSAWPPSLPSVPTSRATRVTSEVNRSSWSAIPLNTVAISSIRGSPVRARRVLKSPPRTAVRPASNCSRPDSSSRGP